MTIPVDLDKGGTNIQLAKVNQGPSLGWVMVVVQDTQPIPEQSTLLYRSQYDQWLPVTVGAGLTFVDGTLSLIGA